MKKKIKSVRISRSDLKQKQKSVLARNCLIDPCLKSNKVNVNIKSAVLNYVEVKDYLKTNPNFYEIFV